MGDNDHDVVKVDQEFFQPPDRIQIQMIGRLIQQKDIRVAEQGTGKQNLYLLIAGQILHQDVMLLCWDPEAVQKGLRV